MTSLYMKAGAILLLIAMACGTLFGAYHHGETVKDGEWQAKWDDRNTRDEAAVTVASEAARALEQFRQQSAEKVQRDAIQKLEQARTDAHGANLAADGLRKRVSDLLLAASKASSNTRPVRVSAPASNPGDLLAVLLDKSVQRNQQLAKIADIARVGGLACEAQYDSIAPQPRKDESEPLH